MKKTSHTQTKIQQFCLLFLIIFSGCSSFTDLDESLDKKASKQSNSSEGPVSKKPDSPVLPFEPAPAGGPPIDAKSLALEIVNLRLSSTGDFAQRGDIYSLLVFRDVEGNPILVTTFNLMGEEASDKNGRWKMSDNTAQSFLSLIDIAVYDEEYDKESEVGRAIPLTDTFLERVSAHVQLIIIDRDGDTGRHDNVLVNRMIEIPYDLPLQSNLVEPVTKEVIFEGFSTEAKTKQNFVVTLRLRVSTLTELFEAQKVQMGWTAQNRNSEPFSVISEQGPKNIPESFALHAQWYYRWFITGEASIPTPQQAMRYKIK